MGWRSRIIPYDRVGKEVEVDGDVVEFLSTPAPHEHTLVDAVAAAGGDTGVQKAAAAAARAAAALVDAYDGEVPVEVLKAMREQAGSAAIEPKLKQRRRLRPVSRMDEDDLLEHDDGAEDDADSSDTADTLKKSAVELWREVAKIEREGADALAERHLETMTRVLRKADPSLTKEQAFAKALENDPTLYTSLRREELRRAGYDVDGDLTSRQARPAGALEAAAAEIRKAAPSLTREQAVAKALENDPTLYERTA